MWEKFYERERHDLVDAEGVQITSGDGVILIEANFMTAINAGSLWRSFALLVHLDFRAVARYTGIEAPFHDGTAPMPLPVLIHRGEEPNNLSNLDRLQRRNVLAEISHHTSDNLSDVALYLPKRSPKILSSSARLRGDHRHCATNSSQAPPSLHLHQLLHPLWQMPPRAPAIRERDWGRDTAHPSDRYERY